jgi:hypothetical protein
MAQARFPFRWFQMSPDKPKEIEIVLGRGGLP